MKARALRTWCFPRDMLRGLGVHALILWVIFAIGYAVLLAVVAYIRPTEISGWDVAATQTVRWYVLLVGVHIAHELLPLHIAHGKTRRDFAIEGAIFLVCFAGLVAALVTLGYALEAGLYRIIDWPQEIGGNHLFTSATQFPWIFAEFWARFIIWGLAGAFIGAGFYRGDRFGGAAILLALLAAVPESIAFGGDLGPLTSVIERLFGTLSVPLPAAITLIGVSALFLVWVSWWMIRDIPLRNQ